MKKQILTILKNPVFFSSAIMVLGSNATNFLNYVYHFVIGRLLGPSSYGELVALISLIGLLGILPTSLNLVVIKFVSSAKNEKEIKNLAGWFQEKTFLTSLLMFVLVVLASGIISNFLKIQDTLLVIIAASTFLFSLPTLLNRSILQGILKFKEYVFSMLAENSIKLILGGVFVYLGFSVLGALVGLLISMAIGLIISRNYIKDFFGKNKADSPKISPLLIYSIPVILYSLAQTSFYTTDLILVKHFFSSHDAGIYASLSTLGKIIFFGTAPIGAVMFPFISNRQSKGKNYLKIFLISLLLTLAVSLIILMLYLLAPILVINILYGSLYTGADNLLIWFGVFIALFSLVNLFVSFYLSIGKIRIVALPIIAAMLQAVAIWFYHQDLKEVIFVSIIITALLLLSLFVYFACETLKQVKKTSNLSNSSSIQTRKNNS